jgi:hypothetical protein
MAPIVGRAVDHLIPWYATLFATFWLAVAQAVQVGAGGIHISAVVISTLGLDIFRQMVQVSLVAKVFSIAPEARARLNAVFILSVCAVHTKLPQSHADELYRSLLVKSWARQSEHRFLSSMDGELEQLSPWDGRDGCSSSSSFVAPMFLGTDGLAMQVD